MFMRSERLFLRPFWPEDWLELLTLIDDEAVVRNLATVPWPYTERDAKAFVERAPERMLPQFLVTLPTADGTRLIGSVGLSRDGQDVELGYWIARSHWGQGYATEAARAVLSQARALGHRRIVAGHFADNPASGRVLGKVGFRPTGERRLRYSEGRKGVALVESYVIMFDERNDCGCEGGEDAVRAA